MVEQTSLQALLWEGWKCLGMLSSSVYQGHDPQQTFALGMRQWRPLTALSTTGGGEPGQISRPVLFDSRRSVSVMTLLQPSNLCEGCSASFNGSVPFHDIISSIVSKVCHRNLCTEVVRRWICSISQRFPPHECHC
jgi:hypothetical protein